MIPRDRHRSACDSILDAIGQTPLVKLNRVTHGLPSGIFGKLKYFSPSRSLKDRIYRQVLQAADQRGDLKRSMTILEGSTGNAGIACAFVGSVLGYPVIEVMPEA